MTLITDTTYGEDLHFFIGEMMNLIDACADKDIEFGGVDGFTLQDCRDTVDWYLEKIGFKKETIEKLWTGEEQLTSS